MIEPDDAFEHAPCGLAVTDADGTVRRVNTVLCGWLGVDADALVGRRRLQDLLTVGGRLLHYTQLAPLLQLQGSVAEVALEFVAGDGRRVPMLVNAARRTRDGQVHNTFAMMVVAERHRYEGELLRARHEAEAALGAQRASEAARSAAEARLRTQAEDRALFAEQTVGIVSHDLRNPLAAIRNGLALLRRLALPDAAASTVERMRASTDRAERLVRDLLDFTEARVGSGLRIRPTPVALHALVADSVDEMVAAHPTRLVRHVAAGEGDCVADPDRLAQLVGNLVSNALAYGAPDRPVTVESRMRQQLFEIEVHNHGTPIPADRIERLFEPMERGSHDGSPHGVGLGLYIVRQIALAHGGTVAVTSDARDGTRFTVCCPSATMASGAA